MTTMTTGELLIACSVLFSILVRSFRAQDVSFCIDFTANDLDPTSPQFPEVPSSFEAVFETSYYEYRSSYLQELHYDTENKIASLTVTTPGVTNWKNFYLYDYNTTSYYAIVENVCKVKPFELDPTNIKMPDPSMIPRPYDMYPAVDILGMPNTTLKKYKGSDRIRGLEVDSWYTCLNMKTSPYHNYSYIATYYFAKNWKSPSSPGNLKQIYIDGMSQYTGQKIVPFTDSYEFYSFTAGVSDRSVFEMPPGVMCDGNITKKYTPPMWVLNYEMGYQNVDYTKHEIMDGRFYWDISENLMRIDKRFVKKTGFTKLEPRSSEILDLNTGIRYRIDRDNHMCQMDAFLKTDMQKYEDIKPLTKRHYFQYNGKRRQLGVDYDVYVTRDATSNSTVLEYLFSTLPWTHLSGSQGSLYKSELLTQRNTYVNNSLTAMVTYYDYSQLSSGGYTVFDVKECVDELFTYDIELEIELDTTFGFHTFSDETIRRAVRRKMLQLTNVSRIRIQREVVRKRYPRYFYMFTLYAKPSNLLKFHKNEKAVTAVNTGNQRANVGAVTYCARYCLMDEKNCLSFDYCSKSQMCRWSGKEISQGSPVTPTESCEHYTKNVARATHEYQPNDYTSLLSNAIFRNEFRIEIGDGVRFGKAMVVRMRSFNDPFKEKNSINDANLRDKFKVEYNTIIRGYNHEHHKRISANECATQCLKPTGFRCESFEYCYRTSDCYLSRKHPGDSGVKTTKDSNSNKYQCDLYSREYISNFGISGSTVVTASPSTYQYVDNPEYCAQLCMKNDLFECLSFQFCYEDKRCVLSEKHKDYVVPTNQTTTCLHYYREYFNDYKRYPNTSVILKPSDLLAQYSGDTYDECPKRCSDEGPQCLGVDYCAVTVNNKRVWICKLTSLSKYVKGAAIKVHDFCMHFSKRLYADGTPVTAVTIDLYNKTNHNHVNSSHHGTHVHQQQSSQHYSSGAMGGLAIGMIVMTLILLAVAGYAYMKIRGKTFDSDFFLKLYKENENL